MSAIKVIVLIPRAADKWLKLESLQTDILQLFIIGKVSLIDKWSKGRQRLLNLECNISFKTLVKEMVLNDLRKAQDRLWKKLLP